MTKTSANGWGTLGVQQYSGNEFEQKNGLNMHDFNARWYDQILGRFLSPDPLAEMDYSTSQYAYCGGNPINRTDPHGLYYYAGYNAVIWIDSHDPYYYDRTTRQMYYSTGSDFYYEESGFGTWFVYYRGEYGGEYGVTVTSQDVYSDNSGHSFSNSYSETFTDDSNNTWNEGGGTFIKPVFDGIGTLASATASTRYREFPNGNGYFVTAKGIKYPLSALQPGANGKYIRGVEGLRNGLQYAKNASALARNTGNFLGWLSAGYSTYLLIQNPTLGNGLDWGISVASALYWEVGAVYLYYQGVAEQVNQIQNNIMTNQHPIQGVYMPGTGDYYNDPFNW